MGNYHQIECNKNNSSKHSKREDVLNNTVSTKGGTDEQKLVSLKDFISSFCCF